MNTIAELEQLTVRRANLTDRVEIAAISDIVMNAFAEGVNEDLLLGWDNGQRKHSETYVACCQELVVGVVCCTVRGQKVYFGLVAVAPAVQGQHVGTRMMQSILESMSAQGRNLFTLHCHRHELIPQSLYRKLGFELMGDDSSVQYMDKTVAIRMELRR
ncbi:MAG TPA: GNAT family N-acetyltransferase [Planktothrix sp.]|jgi:ribosomal protein S18 acetylase RimI-like enzyme